MVHDPLSPSEALRTPIGAVLTVGGLLAFVYSFVIAQLLFGAAVAGALTLGAYLSYRTFAVLDSLADAAQRVAAAREREVDAAESAATHAGADPSRSTPTSTETAFTEREE